MTKFRRYASAAFTATVVTLVLALIVGILLLAVTTVWGRVL